LPPPRWGGLPEKLGGRVRPTSLFMTKICEFCDPVYDLAKNSIPHLWSLQLAQLPKHKLWRAFVDGLIDNDEKVASSKKHTQFKTRALKPYPIYDQNGWPKRRSILWILWSNTTGILIWAVSNDIAKTSLRSVRTVKTSSRYCPSKPPTPTLG